MCPYCNGLTHDEVMFDLDARVQRDGYTLSGCQSSARSPAWLYTIGLELSFDHPELLVVSCDTDIAQRSLLNLADEVRDGRRHDLLPIAPTVMGDAELRPVHASQIAGGALAECSNYYDGIRFRRPIRALQVVADQFCCDRHEISRWDLSAKVPLLNTSPRPNRAARRARPPRRR